MSCHIAKSTWKAARRPRHIFACTTTTTLRPCSTTRRPYSIVTDISFIKPPKAIAYASSRDPEMDVMMAKVSRAYRAHGDAAAMAQYPAQIPNKPWKTRYAIPECHSQLTLENKTGEAEAPIRITVQNGGPGSNQEINKREWTEDLSAQLVLDWLCSDAGRLELPLLQRNSLLAKINTSDRAALTTVLAGLSYEIPFQAAQTLVYTYSLARVLQIPSLEVPLKAKWRQSFDAVPEMTHVYLWALKALNDTGLNPEDPLVAVVLEQLAYSALWNMDRSVFQGGERGTLADYRARIQGLGASLLRTHAPDLVGLEDQLCEEMARMVERVGEEGACDFVSADPGMVYGKI